MRVWTLMAAVACAGAEGLERPDAEGDASPMQALEAGCEGGAAADCAALASLHATDGEPGADSERVVPLLTKACDGGDGGACASLGDRLASGEGVERDRARAAELYNQACTAGTPVGCASLGEMHLSGLGARQDALGGAKLLAKACEGGWGASCSTLSELHALGAKLPRDPGKARQFAQQGCRHDHRRSCFQLAERMILDGDDKDARSVLDALARRDGDAMGADALVLRGLQVAAGEKPEGIGAALIDAWKATGESPPDWSWDALTTHLGDEKKRKSREAVIVIELLGTPRSDGTEAALAAALGLSE